MMSFSLPDMTRSIVRLSMFILRTSVGAILLGVQCVVGAVSADEPRKGTTDRSAEYLAAAKSYELVLTGGEKPLALVEQPILKWTNPERRTMSGSMFLWTENGLPAATMCIYPAKNDLFDHEFKSLSLATLDASRNGRVVWKPKDPGIVYQPLAGAPIPGKNRSARLSQMRLLSREFTANIVNPNISPKPLRMLAAPLYRYPEAGGDGEVIDGAIFAFVHGTDPELLLMIEAVRDDDGDASWRYAPARMSMVPLEVRHDERRVWFMSWAAVSPKRGYYTVHKNAAAAVPGK